MCPSSVLGEEFKYSQSRMSVFRTVHLTDGRKISTRIRIDSMVPGREDAGSAFEYAYLRKRSWPVQSGHSEFVRVVDLFSGCGGLSLGTMEACRALGNSFISVAAVDKDLESLRVYEKNFKPLKTYNADITDFLDGAVGSKPTTNELSLLREVGDVDVLLAGPPCQGYSSLNNYTRQNDARNALYERVARFVEIAEPKHVLIENIPSVTCGKERVVQRSIDLMRRFGYYVDSGVVDLATIGVAQKRRRHVLIATQKELSIREIMEKHRIKRKRSVRWAIADLEDEPPNGIFTTPTKHSEANMRRIEYLHKEACYDLPDWLRPPCHMRGNHRYKSMYGRMKFDEPSQTITRGFLSPGQGRFIHPTRLRTITPHEAARLQGFPDFFDFSEAKKRGSLSSMIGNAVPTKLSYVVCLNMLA